MQKDNIQRPYKGLNQDNQLIDAEKDTYRFALNTINNNNFLENEESNKSYVNLPIGYVPIGKAYMQLGKTILFLVNPTTNTSEIGIFDEKGEYVTHVNDALNTIKLGFKVTHQIQATFRVRRGCDNTIYFTDNLNKPRYYNFDKPQNFKNGVGLWDVDKFNLQKTYSKIPTFEKISVLASGGSVLPGSYNIAVQYVDESLNGTEWISTSNIIKIYNDQESLEYKDINGSTNSDIDFMNFGSTSKAIKIELNNLDEDFFYYRLAIICANNTSGLINNVLYTEVIPIKKTFYIYNGKNAIKTGSLTQIAVFSNIIQKAKSIEQIEDKLIIANTEGKTNNLCDLQKYASKITADCITKEISLSDINDTNSPKNPIEDFNGVGYMPGEIYSFGIVYIFEDSTLSPVYHIPGKNANVSNNLVYDPGPKVYPMNNTNNASNNTFYDGNDQCESLDYWGLDGEGDTLNGKFIRHHRFPFRSEIKKPLVTTAAGQEQTNSYYKLVLTVSGELFIPYCDKVIDPACVPTLRPGFSIRVTYTVDSQDFTFIQNFNPAFYANGTTTFTYIEVIKTSQLHNTNNFTNILIAVTDVNGIYQPNANVTVNTPFSTSDDDVYFNNNASYKIESLQDNYKIQGRNFKTEIFGIKFSNIDIPKTASVNDNKIIGYYIVRNERTEFDKTILDTAVLTPCIKDAKYISTGLLQPEISGNNIDSNVFGVIHPEHKFNNKEYVNYDKIIKQGNFTIDEKRYGKCGYDDVYNGTSFNSENHTSRNDDANSADGSPNSAGFDGWSFNLITRDNFVSFKSQNNFDISKSDIKRRFYLDALGSMPTNDNANEIYNIACDNKIGIIEFNDGVIDNTKKEYMRTLPYVAFYKENKDVYSNFRVLPYYKESANPIYFSTETNNKSAIYNGDTYVTSMKYVNTIYYENRVAKRAGKTSFLDIVLGALVIIAGAALALTGFGAALTPFIVGAGIAIIGGGLLLFSSGLKIDNYNKAYNEEYSKGLRKTVLDDWVNSFYNFQNNAYTQSFGFFGEGGYGQDGPTDDTIEWIADCVSDLWFESTVNISLRNKFTTNATPSFMNSPSNIESGNNSVIITRTINDIPLVNSNAQRYPVSVLEKHVCTKLLAFDQSRDDQRLYIGLALGEFYNLNLDYARKNKEKYFFHLTQDYDCCSNCLEKFPQRWHWTETSFGEDLTDNFRVFLPNNYKDLDGNTGEIINIFKLNNDLFMHTKEALWQVPRNYQERVTDQIVSFIGTGSYGEIPAQKIIDDDTGISAGCQHQWASLKTTYGYYFVSEASKKVYSFSKNGLVAISIEGLSSWFNDNLQLDANKGYYKYNFKDYAYNDNPSNNIGAGYIFTYDAKKERVILSKKDFVFPVLQDCEICTINNQTIQFFGINSTINFYGNLGWIYIGIENCKLKFKRLINKTKTVTKGTIVPNNPEITIYFNETVNYVENEYLFIDGEVADPIEENNSSWTLSYNIKANSWISFHSYYPGFYVHTGANFFSWKRDTLNNALWKHNIKGTYQTYYDTFYPHIIEYVSLSNALVTRVWNHIRLITNTEKYDADLNEFFDFRFATFNKMILHNSRQCSGVVNLIVKDTQLDENNYLTQQIVNKNNNSSVIDKNEKDWLINDFRDIRIDYTKPIWNKNIKTHDAINGRFIDKSLNVSTLDVNKKWSELESFRDKYLVIRLIFDNFTDIKIVTNYTNENEQDSLY